MKFLIALSLLSSQLAFGQQIKLQLGVLKDAERIPVTTKIQFNPETGSAWPEVMYLENYAEGTESLYFRKTVEGLFYSQEESAVIYDNGTEKIKCIEIQTKKWSIFKSKKELLNSRCRFEELVVQKVTKADSKVDPWNENVPAQKYTLTYYYFIID